jgi:hypothetical protein
VQLGDRGLQQALQGRRLSLLKGSDLDMPGALACAGQQSHRVRQLDATREAQVYRSLERHDHANRILVGRPVPVADQPAWPVNLLDSFRDNFQDELAKFQGNSLYFRSIACQEIKQLWRNRMMRTIFWIDGDLSCDGEDYFKTN